MKNIDIPSEFDKFSKDTLFDRYDPKMNKWGLVTAMSARRSSVGATVLECFALEKIINSGKPVI